MCKRAKKPVITEQEYFRVKDAHRKEVGIFAKVRNELRYYKKHLTNAAKSYSIKERLLSLLYFVIYAALFYFCICLVGAIIPQNWKAAAQLGVFVVFFIGLIVIDKLHRTVVCNRLKKDTHTQQKNALAIISCMKSQHVVAEVVIAKAFRAPRIELWSALRAKEA